MSHGNRVISLYFAQNKDDVQSHVLFAMLKFSFFFFEFGNLDVAL